MRILKLILCVCFTGCITGLFSQDLVTAKADESLKNGKYFEAIDLYKLAFSKAKDQNTKRYINYQVACCYYTISDYRQAEVWLKKTTRRDPFSPLAHLYLADVYVANGNYEEALVNYKIYQGLVPDDKRTQTAIESCELSQQWVANPTRHKVVPIYYFNSRESDYATCFARDNYNSVMFTSARDGVTGGDKVNPVTGQNYTDIFISTIDRKGQWSKPEPIEGGVNTPFDEGAPCTNAKANIMWFTSVRPNEKNVLVTQIYESKRSSVEWSAPERVILFESDTIAVGHPAISPDEKTMYFVSSTSGGKGGKDIWYSESESGKWGKPKNLGAEINTAGDELWPFVHTDGTLYFSSNGHPGMGGLDIFSAQKTDGKWQVKNMQYPMNSPRDDFAIVFEREKERGYFSSNRVETRGKDDVFQFALPPLEYKMIVTVKSEKSNEPLSDVSVTVIGSDGTNTAGSTEQNGTLTLNLLPSTDYTLVTRKGGFLAGRGKETTYGIAENKVIEKVIYMTPNDAPRLVNVFYDFGKWDLRPESLTALEELVEILRDDNPNITIELSAHTDSRGSAEFNKDLSQKRAQSVVDFLILYGIDAERLTAVGYGKDRPKLITPKEEQDFQSMPGYGFLRSGVLLNETYNQSLPNEEMQEVAHGLNRRTEFRVTGTDYVPRIRKRK